MTDYFKTIRAYLRGKWGRKRVVPAAPDPDFVVDKISRDLIIDGAITAKRLNLTGLYFESGKFLVRDGVINLTNEIARLRRNKKKHSHLQKHLDDLLNGGAQISDQQTETTK